MGQFPFDRAVILAARKRQLNLCARCGDSLMTQQEIDVVDQKHDIPPLNFLSHAHHVFPQQAGSIDNPSHSWIGTVENCVVIHSDEHFAVHGFDWAEGGVAPPKEFLYSHNIETVKHKEWVRSLTLKCNKIWGPMRKKYKAAKATLQKARNTQN
jgi:hypothetical protein